MWISVDCASQQDFTSGQILAIEGSFVDIHITQCWISQKWHTEPRVAFDRTHCQYTSVFFWYPHSTSLDEHGPLVKWPRQFVSELGTLSEVRHFVNNLWFRCHWDPLLVQLSFRKHSHQIKHWSVYLSFQKERAKTLPLLVSIVNLIVWKVVVFRPL